MEGELVATSPPLTKDSAEKLDLMPEAPSTLSCRDLNSRGGVDLSSDVLHEPIMIIDFNPSTPTHTSNSRQDPHFNGSSFLEGTAVTVDHGGTSSVFAASFNFVNSIVGAGIIGIPYALKLCGFYYGVAMLILVAYLVDQSVIMLISCGIKEGKYDYEELSQHLLGDYGYYATTLFMFMFAFGAQIAYMIIIGDTVPVVLTNAHGSDDGVPSREFVMSMIAAFIILPLCLLKHLSSLSKTSSLSVFSDFILVVIIMSNSVREGKRQGIDTGLDKCSIISSTVFAGIGTISFAFVCQHNSFIVFKSLKKATLDNWRSVAHISVGISLILSLLLGIVGYLSFKEHTRGDILSNFPITNDDINATRVLLAICMTLVFPMECYVSRHCICSVIDKLTIQKHLNGAANNLFASVEFSVLHNNIISPQSHSSVESIQPDSSCTGLPVEFLSINDYTKRKSEDNYIVRSCVSLFLWGSSLSIAIFSGNLGTILALTGALAASFLGFVIPGILFIKVNESHFQQVLGSFYRESEFYEPVICIRLASLKDYLLPIFMIIFGGVLCLLGIFTVLSV